MLNYVGLLPFFVHGGFFPMNGIALDLQAGTSPCAVFRANDERG